MHPSKENKGKKIESESVKKPQVNSRSKTYSPPATGVKAQACWLSDVKTGWLTHNWAKSVTVTTTNNVYYQDSEPYSANPRVNWLVSHPTAGAVV